MKRFLFVLFVFWAPSCRNPPAAKAQTQLEIIAISELPSPNTVPYPNGAAICRCRRENGEEILVSFPAFKNRQILPDFLSLKVGQKISATLIPWTERSQNTRAMAIANDFEDQYELKLFWAETQRTVHPKSQPP